MSDFERNLFFKVVLAYVCERCWSEWFTDGPRPRCQYCRTLMVVKDDPTDEVPVLDRIADKLFIDSGLSAAEPDASDTVHHNAARHDASDE